MRIPSFDQGLMLTVIVLLAAIIVWLWLVPASPSSRAGIGCDSMEGQKVHFHIELELWKQGVPVGLPADVGRTPMCDFWVHTHTSDGIVHIEAPLARRFTLGDVFAVWENNPFGFARSAAEEPGIRVWMKSEGETRFHEVTEPWVGLILVPHTIIAMGTGSFIPKDFVFPKGL